MKSVTLIDVDIPNGFVSETETSSDSTTSRSNILGVMQPPEGWLEGRYGARAASSLAGLMNSGHGHAHVRLTTAGPAMLREAHAVTRSELHTPTSSPVLDVYVPPQALVVMPRNAAGAVMAAALHPVSGVNVTSRSSTCAGPIWFEEASSKRIPSQSCCSKVVNVARSTGLAPEAPSSISILPPAPALHFATVAFLRTSSPPVKWKQPPPLPLRASSIWLSRISTLPPSTPTAPPNSRADERAITLDMMTARPAVTLKAPARPQRLKVPTMELFVITRCACAPFTLTAPPLICASESTINVPSASVTLPPFI
eukprot:1690449-Prymnesium_polylepis.4